MNLSSQQSEAFDKVIDFTKDKSRKRFVLAGYAGTGKTTLAKEIADALDSKKVGFAAYTGKAANVLKEKGCPNSGTIHSKLYRPDGEDEDDQPTFVLDEGGAMSEGKLVVIDEYSMLSKELIADIEKVAQKVLYLGDPFQLPPIEGECSLQPDFFLTEIHRQALENPIIRFSHDVREGKGLTICKYPEFQYDSVKKIDPEAYEDADQVIVGLNKTRVAFNRRFREKLGLAQLPYPVTNDKLICLKNNHIKKIYNGETFYATADAELTQPQTLKIYVDDHELYAWDGNFRGEDRQHVMFKHLDRFDYGYAITAHKSQGSEWDNVLVYMQPIGSNTTEKRRWLYTAMTRARKKLTLVLP